MSKMKQGFTILEVLLAAVLLAIGLVTVFSLADRATYAHAELFASVMAENLAEETLAQVKVKLETIPDNIAKLQGTCDCGMKDVSWQAEIQETEISDLAKVMVTITRPGFSGKKDFTLSSYIYRDRQAK